MRIDNHTRVGFDRANCIVPIHSILLTFVSENVTRSVNEIAPAYFVCATIRHRTPYEGWPETLSPVPYPEG